MAPKSSDPLAGILAAHPEYATWMQIHKAAIPDRGIPIARTKELIPQLSALPGLAPTDYTGQLDEAGKMAKLQLGLALAARGFGSMGAQPRAGEMPISTLGRELLSPLAGDAMTVGQQYYDQKLKLTAAEKAQKAGLTQAALSLAQAEQEGDISFKEKLLLDLASKTALKPTIKALDDVQFKIGENQWVDIPAFSITNPTTGTTEIRDPDGALLVFTGKKLNARIFTDPEGSQYETSESRPIKITPETLALVQKKFGVTLDPELVGQKAFIQTYNPKGDYPDLESYSKLQISGHTFDLRKPLKDQTITPTQLANASEAWAEDDKDTYKSHLVVVDKDTGLALLDDQNRRVEVTLGPDNKPYVIGTKEPYIRPANTSFRSLADYDAAATQEAINRTSRIDTVLSEMSRLQTQQRGEGRTYSARSGLYWDQSRYANDQFPFMYAADPDDPTTYTPIEDPKIQALIKNKVNAVASTMLRSNFGEQSAEVKSDRIAKAVRSILEPTAYTWFGGQEIPDIGYVPVDPTLATASNRVNAKDVMTTLFDDPDGTVDAGLAFSVIPYAPNAEDLSRNPFRLRVASYHFPDAFGAPRTTATGTLEEWQTNYDPGQVQERADIETGIKNARILPDATRADHRAAIQDAAGKIAEARNKEQTKTSAGLAEDEVRMRLEFRRSLLDFRNAAAETGVEGFITGRFAKTLSKIGLADWIVGDGALHWNRLTQASDRLTEGQSRRIGKDFGDDRISNYDAEAYRNLVNKIENGPEYNKTLVEDGLALINRELDGLMQLGGKVGYSERLLEDVAQAGVDFSKLKTQLNWHGHGFYGGNRYSASRQRTPSLSIDNRNHIRRSGELLDSMYDNKYIVPIVGYDGNPPQFSAETVTSPMGPVQFNTWVNKRAKTLGISYEEMFNRAVEGILSYNIFRETMGGE